jgi:hypothetical protein
MFYPIYTKGVASGTGTYKITFENISGFTPTVSLLQGILQRTSLGAMVSIVDVVSDYENNDFSITINVTDASVNIMDVVLAVTALGVDKIQKIEKEISSTIILVGVAGVVALYFIIMKIQK